MGLFNFIHSGTPKKTVVGDMSHWNYTWVRREIPTGAGAGQYAFVSELLPAFSPIGPTQRVWSPFRAVSPAIQQAQTALIVTTPVAGPLNGQFVSQGLLNDAQSDSVPLVPQPAFGDLSSRSFYS